VTLLTCIHDVPGLDLGQYISQLVMCYTSHRVVFDMFNSVSFAFFLLDTCVIDVVGSYYLTVCVHMDDKRY
jgi:hypothetical protein